MSVVEQTLRAQRAVCRDVATEVLRVGVPGLPLKRPKRVVIFGLGSSHFAAQLSAAILRHVQYSDHVDIHACDSTQIGDSFFPSHDDWAIGLSHRAKAGPTLDALKICQQVGAFTALVCGKGAQVDGASESPAHALVHTGPLESVEPHTVAVTSAVCAVTTLLLGPAGQEAWAKFAAGGDPDLARLRAEVARGPAVVIGSGGAEWLARESALKLMEMARLPVRAFGAEEFQHGPQHSLGLGDAVWGFCSPGESFKFSLQREVEVPGFDIVSVGEALVQLQWAALAVALNCSVDPDLRA